ncbi:hypothetical protein KEX41_29680 (plasmid) [Burkholderia thailandensis]|uniref:hypothetical protein n=1 Tax=Burkholderia thailandensis TaxID=57975 RepID=UPI00192D8280|nr:hypothetical protein [Burkholderia thailandensis]MBS2132355.1 hypothetical protein [Burkholderia thailandensis]QRA15160.1 hypothetical protein JMY07_30105 [Burkholderia thailandensis]
MSHDAFPRPVADRTAVLERLLALVLSAGDSYLAEFSRLAALAAASARQMQGGQAGTTLLAELELRARRVREGFALDMDLLRCLHDQVLPTLE